MFIAQYDHMDHAHTRRCQTPEEAAAWIMANDGEWAIEDNLNTADDVSTEPSGHAVFRTMMERLYWRVQAEGGPLKGFCREQ